MPDLCILEDELWQAVQARLTGTRQSPGVAKAIATQFWKHRRARHLLTRLARCGVMTALDADPLARYCVIWGRWLDAEAEIKRKGPIVKTEAGNIIHSPYLAVANRCHRQLAQLESEFGLTPSSRSRVRARLAADEAIRSPRSTSTSES